MSSEPEKDPLEALRLFRSKERSLMVKEMQELIQDAQKRLRSNYTPHREKSKWANLAGKLIWYQDQILRSLQYEALQKEVDELKEKVRPKPPPPPSYAPRRTVPGTRKSFADGTHPKARKVPV